MSRMVHANKPPRGFWLTMALAMACTPALFADDWPQWLGPQRDGVWRETGLIAKFPEGGPKVRWRIPIAAGYGGPAVAQGKVYVMDRERAKDAEGNNLKPTKEQGVLGNERVLCLDAASGKVLWTLPYDCPYKVSYPLGPRVTPIIHEEKVYTLGTMGDLYCLTADTGKVLWKKNVADDYKVTKDMKVVDEDSPPTTPVWGYAAHPLIEGDLLYCLVGGKGSAVVAFNKNTGQEVWKALTSVEVGYAPPMLCEAGGKKQLIVWLSDSVNSLNSATGEVYWTHPFPEKGKPKRPAVSIGTPKLTGDLLLVSTYYEGSMLFRFAPDKPAATMVWADKNDNAAKPEGYRNLMCTPVIKDGHYYGVSGSGDLACYRLDNGKEVWQTFAPVKSKEQLAKEAQGSPKAEEPPEEKNDKNAKEKKQRGIDCGTAFLIEQGDRFFLYNDSGELIIANLSPKGYVEIDRVRLVEPLHTAFGRTVVWSHPAFAQKCVFARNDKEIICVSLAVEDNPK